MTQRIYGVHAVEAALKSGTGIRLLVRKGRLNKRLRDIVSLANARNVEIARVNIEADLLDQGLFLETREIVFQSEKQLTHVLRQNRDNWQFLILDGVTDPRNFGACLRSAASFCVDGVVVSKSKSAPLSAVAIKAASGAASIVPVYQVTNLARCIDRLKRAGIWVVGATLEKATQALPSVDLKVPIAIVMGSEGNGIRPNTAKNCDILAKIPAPLPELSLNVSVATGVCLYEIFRQRSKASSSV